MQDARYAIFWEEAVERVDKPIEGEALRMLGPDGKARPKLVRQQTQALAKLRTGLLPV